MDRFDRYRGCLLGGAAGDALGYPVEFDSRACAISWSRIGSRLRASSSIILIVFSAEKFFAVGLSDCFMHKSSSNHHF